MLKAKLSPSMMCVNVWDNPVQTLRMLEKQHVDFLHIDIMDGRFTPNLTLGIDYIKSLRQKSAIPLDIHLMVENPEMMLDWMDIAEGEYVSVHAESTRHLQRTLSQIRSCGAKPMVALNPATPLVVLDDILNDIGGVLIMTVNPGFAGQKIVPQTLEKIRRLRKWLDKQGYPQIEIEADGNVSFENAVRMRSAGVNIFVGGTSSIFNKNGTVDENIVKLRGLISSEG